MDDDSSFKIKKGHTASTLFVWTAGAIILPISLVGFGTKLIDLILVLTNEVDGAFAATPLVNYLLASIGFMFIILWAATGGMFSDVEQPKQNMLENEQRLDAHKHIYGVPARQKRKV